MAITWKKIAYYTDIAAVAPAKSTWTTKGDILVATGASTPVRVGVGTNTHVLTADSAVAAGVKWAEAAGGGSATLEFFVPATGTQDGIANHYLGDFAVIQLNVGGEYAYMTFKVPHDFASITSAEVIVIPTATQASANWNIYSDYGAVGEAYTTHSESDAAATYNVVNNQLFAVDVSGILSAVAADDYVGINIQEGAHGHNLDVLGIRFRYAA